MGIENLWNLVLTLGIGAIGYLIKELKKTVDDQIRSMNDRIEKIDAKHDGRVRELEKEFANYREKLPQHYVSRDDFVRAIAGLDNRVERGLLNINEQLQKLINQFKGG